MSKFCKDCKHFKPGNHNEPSAQMEFARCWHATAIKIGVDLVSGRTWQEARFCSIMREHGECGADGKLWMAAESSDAS